MNTGIRQVLNREFYLVIVLILSLCLGGFAQKKNDSIKKVNFAGIPVINYSNAIGLSAGVMGQMFYKVSEKDTISPTSSTGVFGMYSTNNTFFAAAFQKLYLNEDKWRVMFGLGLGNINYQYWQEIPVVGGDFIGFNTRAEFAMLKVERKLVGKLYGGLRTVISTSKTDFDLPDFLPPELLTDERRMNSLGYLFNYDERDNQLNPYEGFNVEFKNDFFRKWLNSEDDFESFELTYNHYYPLSSERKIIVTRATASIATGDVPFQGQNVVGQDDIRGYSNGKYRDNQVYAIQSEYRWRFENKFGMVGFFGLATAVENFSGLGKAEILPGGGVGIRYMMIPKERINIGVDVAAGKGDWGLYFRIGESFGR
ncbi:BamA/TamA family outer membrane protein [uncultured Algibacter sp.]|uniref:BamA/TamA family outer membrane protein n=1 Tax=uncultured Algibacter sp. TaxID=298659 RepID=UPI00260BA63D|nr:BamA/TamA family outer membrane protein [uncultured Algibacter sp.]